MFTTFILYLTDKYKDGAIAEDFKNPKGFANSATPVVLAPLKNCTGSYQILNNDCRQYLVKTSNSVQGFCDGTSSFEVSYFPHFDTFVSKEVEQKLKKFHDAENTYIVVSAGTHFNSDYRSFIQYFFEYMVKLKNKRTWPHYIVETLHDVLSPESTAKRHTFNDMVKRKAQQLGVDVFDSSHLSKGLETFDGRTYGMAFHSLKTRVLMHYFYNKLSC